MSLADLASPTAVKRAIAECDLLGRDEFLAHYGYGAAREYVVRYDDKDYDSKAIAGVAHGFEFPDLGPLKSEDFSGGVSVGAAARKLSDLGFKIAGLSSPDGWSLEECEITVDAYFRCVALQIDGKPFVKSHIYREIARQLNSRTAKAVEYKFQNIEKVLEEEDLPRLGMSTKGNYQRLLRPVVLDYLQQHPEIGSRAPRTVPAIKSWSTALVEPPKGRKKPPGEGGVATSVRVRVARTDAENRRLGRLGEEWILKLEKERLVGAGRGDLAQKVVWVSDVEGDGAGYDIRSFDDAGNTIFIEVKTTNGGKTTDFLITINELKTSDRIGKAFRLYRVFDFSHDPMLYLIEGPLSDKLLLSPRSFSACCKA
jgi:Domain of unknown function (DUF3883)